MKNTRLAPKQRVSDARDENDVTEKNFCSHNNVHYDEAFSSTDILFEKESAHQRIQVAEKDGKRYMLFGPRQEEETACLLENPDVPLFEYPCLMAPALALQPETRSVLLIGLGGGYLARLFQCYRPNIAVTVVEIDPLVLEVAEKFFGFAPDDSVHVEIADGRGFLEKTDSRYDQIWLDAYDGEYIPPHLTTIEFFRLCRERLKFRGVVVQNVHVENALFAAHQATMTDAFGYCYLFRGAWGANAALTAQKDVARPSSVKQAFAKGLKLHGTRFGGINLSAELRKATIAEYVDPFAVLTDETA